MYELYRELEVKTTREKAWEFIRSPGNLNKITPDDLSFEIVSDLPDEMFEGMLVEYRVNIPVIGKQEWVSELQHIVPGYSFVDEQKIGPYKLWYHYHGIEEVEGGVKLIDRVSYKPPFGFLGTIANALFIRKMLEKIFNYRTVAFRELLES